MTLKASDLGVWVWNIDGTKARWEWRYKKDEVQIVDRDEKRAGTPVQQGKFLLTIEFDGMVFNVATQAWSPSARRWNTFQAVDEAQAHALRWLDRRFKAQLKEVSAA